MDGSSNFTNAMEKLKATSHNDKDGMKRHTVNALIQLRSEMLEKIDAAILATVESGRDKRETAQE